MRTKLNTPLPRVVWDDEWEGPRPSGVRVTLVGVALWIGVIAGCVAFLTHLDKLWEPDGHPAWVPSVSEPSALAPTVASRAEAMLGSPPPERRPPVAPPPVVRQPVVEPPPVRSVAPQPAAPAVRRPATATEPATGYISVNSTPWAELSVDGRVMGTTPQIKLGVLPGRHHLLLTREGFQTHSAWVTVVAGGSVRVTDIVLKAITP